MLWDVDCQTPMCDLDRAKAPESITGFPDWYVGAAALTSAFGPYRLLRDFGGGGMARVFLAEPTASGSLVALKVPKLPLEQDSGSLESRATREQRFLREAHFTEWLGASGLCVPWMSVIWSAPAVLLLAVCRRGYDDLL